MVVKRKSSDADYSINSQGVSPQDGCGAATATPADMRIEHVLASQVLLFYYILLDFDQEPTQRALASDEFAAKFGMPVNYQLFMKGLWYLDRKEFSV